MRFFLIGFMGSGKTYIANAIAKHITIPTIDLDAYIEEKEQEPIVSIFENYGEQYFRMLENKYLQEIIDTHEHLILACGGGTPCFKNNIWLLRKYGVTIYIKTDTNTIVQRVKDNTTRPLLQYTNENELKNRIEKMIEEREVFYKQATHCIPNDSYCIDTILKIINTTTHV